jgi:hypothetical protein
MGFAETNANSRNKCKFLQMAIINHFKRAVLVQIPETQDFLKKTAIHSYIWALPKQMQIPETNANSYKWLSSTISSGPCSCKFPKHKISLKKQLSIPTYGLKHQKHGLAEATTDRSCSVC